MLGDAACLAAAAAGAATHNFPQCLRPVVSASWCSSRGFELDHELLVAHLARGGLSAQTRRVDTESAFLDALDEPWDAVVSDYNLPGFSGLVALELLKASTREIPFILVSGEIGDDTAVEAMRNGASDYLQKSHLARLVPALLHAVDAAETRRARVKADRDLVASKQRLHELAQHLQTSVEQERAAIAREIHDDVGGSLTALKFDLAWIARHSSSPQIVSRVQSALETVTHAVESSQRIMHNLRPAILEQGLAAALHWIALRSRPHGRRGRSACRGSRRAAAHGDPGRVGTARSAKNIPSTRRRRGADDLSLDGGVLSLEISDNGRVARHDSPVALVRNPRLHDERAVALDRHVDGRTATLILGAAGIPTAHTCRLRQVVRPRQWADV